MDAKHEEIIIEGSVVDEETVVEAEDAHDVVQASTLKTSTPDNSAPDTYAVAIHVMRMAPAWLLTTSVSFVLLILVLSWIRPDASASGKAFSNPNDSKAPEANSAILPAPAVAKAEKHVAEAAPVAEVVSDKAISSEATASAEPASTVSTSPSESQPVAIVAPEESASSAAPEKQASVAGDSGQKFTVQVGSHSNESGANEQVSRLRAAGFDARSVSVELPGRGKWYRVQAGSFDDRAGASKDAALLRAKGLASAAIVVPR